MDCTTYQATNITEGQHFPSLNLVYVYGQAGYTKQSRWTLPPVQDAGQYLMMVELDGHNVRLPVVHCCSECTVIRLDRPRARRSSLVEQACENASTSKVQIYVEILRVRIDAIQRKSTPLT